MDFVGAKGNGSGGNNWSYEMRNDPVTTNKPASSFLQAGCPYCPQTNSVKH